MKPLTRVKDWDRHLALVTERHLTTPSDYGTSDCLLKVADAIAAVTGVDLAAQLRGTYETEQGAAKVMRRMKCANAEEVLAKYFEPVGRLMAQRGDVVSVLDRGEIAAGYVTEYGVAVATPKGVSFRPQTDETIQKAFKVGR